MVRQLPARECARHHPIGMNLGVLRRPGAWPAVGLVAALLYAPHDMPGPAPAGGFVLKCHVGHR